MTDRSSEPSWIYDLIESGDASPETVDAAARARAPKLSLQPREQKLCPCVKCRSFRRERAAITAWHDVLGSRELAVSRGLSVIVVTRACHDRALRAALTSELNVCEIARLRGRAFSDARDAASELFERFSCEAADVGLDLTPRLQSSASSLTSLAVMTAVTSASAACGSSPADKLLYLDGADAGVHPEHVTLLSAMLSACAHESSRVIIASCHSRDLGAHAEREFVAETTSAAPLTLRSA